MKKQKPKVVIVDYEVGNLFSLERVVNHLGGIAVISDNSQTIKMAERLILPGVGAFGDGMKHLRDKGLVEAIQGFVSSARPLLGICLGMQLIMTESEEYGLHQGLNLIPGRVIRFQKPCAEKDFYKIPHVGWNSLNKTSNFLGDDLWKNTIFCTTQERSFVYFVHSYIVIPEDAGVKLTETQYGRDVFCSALRKENIYGCQFHPELSGEVGLNILREFLFSDKGDVDVFSRKNIGSTVSKES